MYPYSRIVHIHRRPDGLSTRLDVPNTLNRHPPGTKNTIGSVIEVNPQIFYIFHNKVKINLRGKQPLNFNQVHITGKL